MPFTNIETVRQHLSEPGAVRDTFRDVALPLVGTSPAVLVHANLRPGTVKVKGKEIGSPSNQSVVLGSQPVTLAAPELIPDSVVVASDSSLGTIYTENSDYHIDYAVGTISRTTTGAITAGDQVAVWYYAYRIFVEASDYAVNYEKGTIRRVPTGAITDGQVVFVDYEAQAGGFDDFQIGNAIAEADDILLKSIDPGYQESNDQTLVTAETYLTLAILCRLKASRALESSSVVGAAEISRSWRELADRYDADGLRLAARYTTTTGCMQAPTIVTGGRSA
jgi:hypothetical protein